MTLFRPSDENSLRHLFSSRYAEEILGLAYLGPVLNPAGAIESSPDCLIIDRRKSPFRPLRCEFKFIPAAGKEDFAHNGMFDIAIVWALPKGHGRDDLLKDLLQQNGCSELIVLEEDFKALRDLPVYSAQSISQLGDTQIIREIAIYMKLPAVFGLCMAAQLYPDKFDREKMVNFLSKRFSEVKKMQPKGRANVISAFLQTKPPLITHMHGSVYRWTNEFDSVTAANELMQLITSNFESQVPTKDDLSEVRE